MLPSRNRKGLVYVLVTKTVLYQYSILSYKYAQRADVAEKGVKWLALSTVSEPKTNHRFRYGSIDTISLMKVIMYLLISMVNESRIKINRMRILLLTLSGNRDVCDFKDAFFLNQIDVLGKSPKICHFAMILTSI